MEGMALPPRERYIRWSGLFTDADAAELCQPDFLTGVQEQARDVVDARVAYRDLGAGKDASERGVLGLALRGNTPGELDAVVLDRLTRSETTAALQEANSLFSLGKGAEARKRLDDARRSVDEARQGAKQRAPKPRAAAVDRSFEEQGKQLDDARFAEVAGLWRKALRL